MSLSREKRKHTRLPVEGKVDLRVVTTSRTEILDVSLGGVRFLSGERVLPRNRIRLVIRGEDLEVALQGVVVRSRLRKVNPPPRWAPVTYEVAVSFEDLDDRERSGLQTLLRAFGKE